MSNILIIDVATSSFRANSGVILEVAAALLENARTLEVLDVFSSVCAAPADTKVSDFHKQLLAECSAPGVPELREVEGQLIAKGWDFAAVCNRALDFDLEWIRAHMPSLANTLRTKVQIELKGLEFLAGIKWQSSMPRTYRACDDVVAAIKELCAYGVVRR